MQYGPVTASAPSSRACAFCGHRGSLTKEHVYPQWIWREFGQGKKPPPVADGRAFGYREQIIPIGSNGHIQSMTPRLSRPYLHATHRKVRAVCATCNNEWMSQLERRAREILLRIAGRREWRFSDADLRILRRWLAKTGLMMENFDPETKLAGQAVYDAVMNDEEPPGSWYFGLARVTKWDDCEAYLAPLLAEVHEGENFPGKLLGAQIYATEYLISVNRLLFIARYSPYPVVPPARLDHGLPRLPQGQPVPLRREDAGSPIKASKLPMLDPATIEWLFTWGHAVDRNFQMSLLGDGTKMWIGHMQTASSDALGGAWGDLLE